MSDHIYLTSSKLSVDEVTQIVSSPDCGAISLYVGTVKDNYEGKRVKQVEYEAYTPMAEAEIRKICGIVRQKWRVQNMAVFHRLGTVCVMDAIVILAISSEHRHDAMEAVTFTINALRSAVPIWKQEIYEEDDTNADCPVTD